MRPPRPDSRNQACWARSRRRKSLSRSTAVVVDNGLRKMPISRSGSPGSPSLVLTLGAALLYAVATILAKGLGQQRAAVTVLCQTLVGVVMLAPFADIGHPMPPASWGWLAGIGILPTGIAYVLMNSAFPRLTTPVIGIVTFIYPVVAIIDWALYAHPLRPAQAAGIVLIALATLGVRLGWRFPVRRVSVA
ncbi:DMT family transporter [Mesorhizobium sp. B2-4-6]|nr:DMT family transporter [Mesorhizobium sp. B2-4-6]